MRFSILAIVAALAASVHGATCASSLSCLTSNSAASSYCSSALASTAVAIVSKTVTLSDVPTQTVYVVSTKSVVSRSTTTTFVASSTSVAVRRRRRRAESCGDAESLLSALDSSQLSEACSCIGASSSDSDALLADSAATTITGEVWFTVSPAVTVSSTRTVSVRTTETITLIAPTFTQAWGPQSGCVDVGYYYFESYVSEGISEDEVIKSCETGCANKASCMFAFVQLQYPGGSQFYNCYHNTHAFDEATDIECGKDTSKYGSAKGFSAVGRG